MARALRVDKSVLIRNSADVMFKAITLRGELSRWFADAASSDVREGAMIEFTWGVGPTARRSRARVLRLEPGKTVMMRWENGSSQSRDDYFSLTLEKQKAGILVSAVDFAARDTQAELEEVWDECLKKMKLVYDGKGANASNVAAPVAPPKKVIVAKPVKAAKPGAAPATKAKPALATATKAKPAPATATTAKPVSAAKKK